ncbi:nucleoside deaminase [Methanohalophilus sp.]
MNQFMKEAINEAMASRDKGGIPIGSVLVRNGKIIARGHNLRVQDNDPLAHAEISCMRDAGRIGSYADTVLYSTLMPCYLCAGAVVQFGIKKVVAGESETFEGAQDFLRSKGVEVVDLDISECKMLMKEFIREYPELWNEDIGESVPY